MTSAYLTAPGGFRQYRTGFRLFPFLCVITAIAGCQSVSWPLTGFRPGAVDFDRITRAQSAGEESTKPTLLDRLILGRGAPIRLNGNRLSNGKDTSQSSLLEQREKADREVLQRAQLLYENGDYAGASELFAVTAKERNPKRFKLFSARRDNQRPVYDPIREEAVFYLAESQFMQDHLVKAQEYYQVLVKEFPQSRYLDESTRRLFDIAQRWLGVEGFATSGEIEQVSFDGTQGKALSTLKPARKRFGWLPNFTNPSRPVLDTSGRAVQALKTIWLNDPTGPLADDALMLAATHHLRAGKYRESARLLKILREEFP
ncbi:MAG: tetratricopeptide repeat protein, partial [Planctomycetaceae bacterium]